MQNKLDPRQYTPYALNTPSGNLSFILGNTSFECYLLENQSGNFNYTGSLKINNGPVLFTNPSNTFGGTNVSIFNSTNAYATGQSNSILGSNNSELSGQNNTILGGSDNQVGSSDYGTILGGRNSLLSHTGATLLGDGNNARQKKSVEHYSLTVDFASGLFVQNKTYINGDFYVTGGNSYLRNFFVDPSYSGVFSGDLQVLGNAYHTGSPYQDLQNLRDASGILQNLTLSSSGTLRSLATGLSGAFDGKLSTTGSSLLSINLSTSGALTSDFNSKFSTCVRTTGNQTVDGRKFFNEGTFFNFISGRDIQSTGRFILGSGRFIPSAFNSLGTSGQISWSNGYLYICTGNNAWGRIAIGNF